MSMRSLIIALDACLFPIGFVRKGAVWNRRVGEFIDVIDLQIAASRDTVTVNAGVIDSRVHMSIWGGELPDFVEEPLSTVRARIGELMDHKDRWWRIGSDKSSVEIVDAVRQVVLPFLQRMHGRAEMVSWLERIEVVRTRQPVEVLGLAVIKDLIGSHSEACELLAVQRKRTIGAWGNRFDEVAQQLGCISGDHLPRR
jgi:hypothetical protein